MHNSALNVIAMKLITWLIYEAISHDRNEILNKVWFQMVNYMHSWNTQIYCNVGTYDGYGINKGIIKHFNNQNNFSDNIDIISTKTT